MKSRTTLVYLAVLVVLAGITFFLQRNVKSSDEQARTEKKLFTLKQEDVTRLEISHSGSSVVLEKNDGKWSILKPLATAADESAVSSVLSELEFSQSERTLEPESFPKDKDPRKHFGFDSATCQVTATTKTGIQTIWIGRKTAFGDNFYARMKDAADAPIYIVRTSTKTSLDKTLNDLRSRKVFDLVTSDVNQVNLRRTAPDGHSTNEHLASRTGEAWVLEKPLNARADAQKVNSLLANAVSLQVQDFVADDSSNLTTYGLATPSVQFILRSGKDNRESTLLLGSIDPKKPTNVYAKTLQGNTVFTLTKSSVDQMINAVPEVRDRRLLVFDATKISKFALKAKGKSVEASLVNGNWTITPGGFEGDTELIQAQLSKLAAINASAFLRESAVDLKPYGLDKPLAQATLTLTDKDKVTTVELFLGKQEKGQLFARNGSEPFIAAVAPTTLDDLGLEPFQLRKTQIINVDPAKIKKFSLTDTAGKVTTFQRKPDNSFESDAAGRIVDAVAISSLLNNYSHLRAAKWIGTPLPYYGLAKPYSSVSFTTDTETTLRLGAVLSTGNRAAQIGNDPMVFEVSSADVETLTKLPLMPIAPSPTKLTVVTPAIPAK